MLVLVLLYSWMSSVACDESCWSLNLFLRFVNGVNHKKAFVKLLWNLLRDNVPEKIWARKVVDPSWSQILFWDVLSTNLFLRSSKWPAEVSYQAHIMRKCGISTSINSRRGYNGCDLHTGARRTMQAHWVCVFDSTLAIRFQEGWQTPLFLTSSVGRYLSSCQRIGLPAEVAEALVS